MIAHKLHMRNPSKSSIIRLVSYLADKQGHEQRVHTSWTTNLESEDLQWAGIEMRAVQRMNVRSKADKTYHLVISFPTGETPNLDTLKSIENDVCTKLGYGEHQRVAIVHTDTDNLHIQVAINKVHPTKYTVLEPYCDYKILRNASKEAEQKYGLKADNHEVKTNARETAAKKMEHFADMESLIGWVQRNCLEELKAAKSWEELHSVLAKNGLAISPRGNGLVIKGGDVHCKASSVDRGMSKVALEKRFGEFREVPVTAEAEQTYEKKPMKHNYDTSKLWETYNATREANRQAWLAQKEKIQQQKTLELERIRTQANLHYKLVRALKMGPILRGILLNMEKRSAAKARQAVYAKYKNPAPPQTWREYLEQEALAGNEDALKAIQARAIKEAAMPNRIYGVRQEGIAADEAVKVTNKGNMIMPDGSRDNGETFYFPDFVRDDNLKRAYLRAVRVHRGHLEVEGSEEFKGKLVELSAEPGMPPVSFKNSDMQQQRLHILAERERSEARSRSKSFFWSR